ncbi:MAG: 6-carboxytetrahydropterin synthase QueD [Candidatus Omnitrophica bacterium]|nr:6-carboxytetrahydropterin synthase QueD [Candidatus Omnitrophota bacterium]
MYEVRIISDFSAAHMLRHYKGKCENMHGHNWKVEVSLSSGKLDRLGMVVDFKSLKKTVGLILEKLDHKNLNDLSYFKKANPTSENIAKYIYDRIKDRGAGPRTVTVWESETACATYGE